MVKTKIAIIFMLAFQITTAKLCFDYMYDNYNKLNESISSTNNYHDNHTWIVLDTMMRSWHQEAHSGTFEDCERCRVMNTERRNYSDFESVNYEDLN